MSEPLSSRIGVFAGIGILVGLGCLVIALISVFNTAFDLDLALGVSGTSTALPSSYDAVAGLAGVGVLLIALSLFGSAVLNKFADAKGKPLLRVGILVGALALLGIVGRGLQIVFLTATYGSMLAYYATDGDLDDVRAELAKGPSRADLDAIDVGGGEHVPDLRRVLAFCHRHSLRVNVELKSDLHPDLRTQAAQQLRLVQGCAALMRELTDPGDFVLFSSFNPLLVGALRRLVPHVPAAWLVHEGQPRMLRATRNRAARGALRLDAVHPQGKLATADLVGEWHAQGCVVNVWTVNDGAEARRLSDAGVDAIISDCPGSLRSSLSE